MPTTTQDLPPTIVLDVGMVRTIVCSNEPDETIEAYVNANHPTGISSRWKLIDPGDGVMGDGNPYPSPCPERPGHFHYILNC